MTERLERDAAVTFGAQRDCSVTLEAAAETFKSIA